MSFPYPPNKVPNFKKYSLLSSSLLKCLCLYPNFQPIQIRVESVPGFRPSDVKRLSYPISSFWLTLITLSKKWSKTSQHLWYIQYGCQKPQTQSGLDRGLLTTSSKPSIPPHPTLNSLLFYIWTNITWFSLQHNVLLIPTAALPSFYPPQTLWSKKVQTFIYVKK